MAALYKKEEHFCTGSRISRDHILTAAQCLKEFFDCEFSGFSEYFAIDEPMKLFHGRKKYYFKQVKIHGEYNFESSDITNNIGLIMVLI